MRIRSSDTAKPFAAGVYGFTDEGAYIILDCLFSVVEERPMFNVGQGIRWVQQLTVARRCAKQAGESAFIWNTSTVLILGIELG